MRTKRKKNSLKIVMGHALLVPLLMITMSDKHQQFVRADCKYTLYLCNVLGI